VRQTSITGMNRKASHDRAQRLHNSAANEKEKGGKGKGEKGVTSKYGKEPKERPKR
jgi:hypothetical protein